MTIADPIFGMIEEHKRINAIHGQRISETDAAQVAYGRGSPAHMAARAAQSEACWRDLDCRDLILVTVPTTIDGMVTYLDHIESPLGFGETEPDANSFDAVCSIVRTFLNQFADQHQQLK